MDSTALRAPAPSRAAARSLRRTDRSRRSRHCCRDLRHLPERRHRAAPFGSTALRPRHSVAYWQETMGHCHLTWPAHESGVYRPGLAGRRQYRPPTIRRSATHPIGRPHGSMTLKPSAEWIPVAKVPALVTQEQFDLVRAKLAQNQSFARRHNTHHQYLLRAMVSCGLCQLACFARTLPKAKYGYYICTGKDKAVQNRREDKCPSRFIPAQQLDELVWLDL